MRSTLHRALALGGALVICLSIAGATAAKPPNVPGYHIDRVVAVSAGPDTVGCAVDVTATFKVRKESEATYLRFTQTRLPDGATSTPTQSIENAVHVGPLPPKAHAWGGKWTITQRFAEVGIDDLALGWTWGAQLLSGYWDDAWFVEPLTVNATSRPFMAIEASCPAAGTVLARFP